MMRICRSASSGRQRNQGIVFIVILGMLTILVMIAVVFSMLSRVEQATSANYINTVYSRLLARSGIETALAYVAESELIEKGLSPTVYGIEFDDTNQNNRYDPDKEAVIRVNPDAALEHCRFPSLKGYGILSGDSSEATVKRGVNTETIGYSGSLPAESAGCKNIYSLRIRDCASMLYVNGPSVSASNWALAPSARRMLNNMGNQFNISRLGDIVSAARAAQKRNFASREEIKTALMDKGYKESDYKAIKDFITCYAWVDSQTLLPGAFTPMNGDNNYKNINRKWSYKSMPADGLPIAGLLNTGYGGKWLMPSLGQILACCPDDYAITNKGPSGFKSQPSPEKTAGSTAQPGRTPLIQPRAPVNINTAPACVLRAMLEGIAGNYLDRARKTAAAPGFYLANCTDLKISAPTALEIADAIIARRKDRMFNSYADFNEFINGLTMITPEQKAVIKANANPNSHLAKFNPDKTMGNRFGDTDKSDLGAWTPSSGSDSDCGWSTEFCFSSMGYYEVESLGQVLSPPDELGTRKIIARSKASAILKVYNVLRHSTQKDFEKYTAKRDGITFFPESLDDLKSSAYWNTVQTKCLDKPESECSHQLCYDGYATLTPQDIQSDADYLLKADYGGTLNAVASGDPKAYGMADEDRSLIDPDDPSELFPDGVFCHETRRAGYRQNQTTYGDTADSIDEYLRYSAEKNFPKNGSLEFWFKPAWNASELQNVTFGSLTRYPYSETRGADDTRALFTMGYGEDYSGIGDGVDERLILIVRKENNQAFVACHYATCMQGPYGRRQAQRRHTFPYLMMPSLHSAWGKYGIAKSNINWSAGEWHHLALSWNPSTIRLFVDGAEAMGSPLTNHRDAFPKGILKNWSLYIGNNRFEDIKCNGYPLNADGTIDSLRIYDKEIGGSFIPPDRYDGSTSAKGFTGTFSPTDCPAIKKGGRLGRISWSWLRPINGTGGIEFEVTAGGSTVTVPAETEGKGYNLNLPLTEGESVSYRAKFSAPDPNPAGFIDESPVLDDVTITIFNQMEFLSYGID